MFNDGFLNGVDEVIGATADSSQAVDELSVLLESQVSVEAFINKLLLYGFPELVVL